MIPAHLPLLSIVSYLIAAAVVPLFSGKGGRGSHGIAVAVCAGVFIINVIGLPAVQAAGEIRYAVGGWEPPMGIELMLDPLAAFFVLMIAGVAGLVLWHARHPVRADMEERGPIFYSATLLMLGALTGMVLTADLFNLYVFLEIAALSGYALLGSSSARGAVATFRYLILGTVGASLYLMGIGLMFLESGTLNMADLTAILAVTGLSPLMVLGVVFIVAGIGLKMALFPLHLWLPDVYTAGSSTATALIAPLGTKIAAYVLIRILFYVFEPNWMRNDLPFTLVIGWLGAIGIVWGSIMAIAQDNLRRMLAYSSVAQIGYIALGVGLGNAYGFIGAVLHALNHACMKACLFLVSGNLRMAGRSQSIAKLDASLQRSMPWTSAAFTLAALSMIGLPPLAGFFSKWYLLLGSWEQGSWIFLVVIVVSSLLNAVYFFRVIERMYLKGGAKEPDPRETEDSKDRSLSLVMPTMVLGVGLLLLGFANVLIVNGLIRPMLPGGF